MGKSIDEVPDRVMEILVAHHWPGNIRELRNVLERALLRIQGSEIRSEDLLLSTNEPSSITPAGGGLPTSEWEIRPLDDVMSDYVTASVKAVDGNMRKASRLLQISPSPAVATAPCAGSASVSVAATRPSPAPLMTARRPNG